MSRRRVSPDPVTPRQPVAPDTHPLELERLAIQEQRHPGCVPLRVQAIIWVLRAYSAVTNAQTEELRAAGLSPSAFNVLMALLNTSERTLEPRQISERLLVSRPSVTGLLDTLQQKGLVRRAPHPDDRRRVLVSLTPRAERLLKQHSPTHYAGHAEILADLDADELANLVVLLRRIRGATPEHLRSDTVVPDT